MAAPTGCAASGRRGVEDAAPYGWGGGVPGIVILSAAKDPYPTGRWTEFASGKSHSFRMPGGQWPPLRGVRRRPRICHPERSEGSVSPRSVVGICLRQIAFVPNAGRPMTAPTGVPRRDVRGVEDAAPYGRTASERRRPESGRPTQTCSLFPVPSSPIAYCLLPDA